MGLKKMSNLWFNISIGAYHIQIGDPKWYSIKVSFNDYYKYMKGGKYKIKIHKFLKYVRSGRDFYVI